MKGGTPTYVREGRVYEGGPFGGDLDEAVRGNPEAEAHAKAFQNGMMGGFLSVMAGVASTVGGTTLYLANSNAPSNERDATAQTAGAVLVVGGLVSYVVGLTLLTIAQPHQWDAINIYNDGVSDGGRPPPHGPYAPPPPGPYAPPPPQGSNGPGLPSPGRPAGSGP